MGKEKKDANMFKMGRFMHKAAHNIQNERQELAKVWGNAQSITFKDQITEDGLVTVTLKSNCIDLTIVCKGMMNEGNKFENLAMLLRVKSLILENEKIEAYYIHKGHTWSQVDIKDERFRSGDQIMISIKERKIVRKKAACKVSLLIRKAIKKPSLC